MIGRKLWLLTLVLVAALVFAGCSNDNSGGGGSNQSPSPTDTSKADSDCKNVVDKGQTLATTVASFLGGQASANEVERAARNFTNAVDNAKSTIKPQVKSNLDKAESASKQMVDALQAQPVDTAKLRTAASDLAAAIGAAATIC